jgi:hypothetical protein
VQTILRNLAAASPLVISLLLPASAMAQAGTPVWTNRYNGPANGNDNARAIVVDTAGNLIATGDSSEDFRWETTSSARWLLSPAAQSSSCSPPPSMTPDRSSPRPTSCCRRGGRGKWQPFFHGRVSSTKENL